MKRAQLLIVTPALRDANNGNWQTAARWARLLAADYRVRLLRENPGVVADRPLRDYVPLCRSGEEIMRLAR